MKKTQTALILLLSLAVVIGGAFLPRLMAARQDAAGEKPGYAPIGEISLEFDDRDRGLGIRDKYAVFTMEHDALTLPVSMAGKTTAQVEALARKAITEYQSAGLIPALSMPLTKDRIRMIPQMLRPLGEDTGFILWDVTINLDPANERILYFLLDDETGDILTISYQESIPYEPSEMDLWALSNKLPQLCTTFLDGLGSEFPQEERQALTTNTTTYLEYEYAETFLGWADMLYGEMRLRFVMAPAFFSVSIMK